MMVLASLSSALVAHAVLTEGNLDCSFGDWAQCAAKVAECTSTCSESGVTSPACITCFGSSYNQCYGCLNDESKLVGETTISSSELTVTVDNLGCSFGDWAQCAGKVAECASTCSEKGVSSPDCISCFGSSYNQCYKCLNDESKHVGGTSKLSTELAVTDGNLSCSFGDWAECASIVAECAGTCSESGVTSPDCISCFGNSYNQCYGCLNGESADDASLDAPKNMCKCDYRGVQYNSNGAGYCFLDSVPCVLLTGVIAPVTWDWAACVGPLGVQLDCNMLSDANLSCSFGEWAHCAAVVAQCAGTCSANVTSPACISCFGSSYDECSKCLSDETLVGGSFERSSELTVIDDASMTAAVAMCECDYNGPLYDSDSDIYYCYLESVPCVLLNGYIAPVTWDWAACVGPLGVQLDCWSLADSETDAQIDAKLGCSFGKWAECASVVAECAATCSDSITSPECISCFGSSYNSCVQCLSDDSTVGGSSKTSSEITVTDNNLSCSIGDWAQCAAVVAQCAGTCSDEGVTSPACISCFGSSYDQCYGCLSVESTNDSALDAAVAMCECDSNGVQYAPNGAGYCFLETVPCVMLNGYIAPVTWDWAACVGPLGVQLDCWSLAAPKTDAKLGCSFGKWAQCASVVAECASTCSKSVASPACIECFGSSYNTCVECLSEESTLVGGISKPSKDYGLRIFTVTA